MLCHDSLCQFEVCTVIVPRIHFFLELVSEAILNFLERIEITLYTEEDSILEGFFSEFFLFYLIFLHSHVRQVVLFGKL